MQIKEIHYGRHFSRQFLALPRSIQRKTWKAEQLLRENPFHPSLRLHKLKGGLDGSWGISVDRKHRIVFKPLDNGVILFASIGSHAIYSD